MRAISKCIRKNTELENSLGNEIWAKLLDVFSEDFVDEIWCAKVPHPNLKCSFGSTAFVPKLTKRSCTNGKCEGYGREEKLSIRNCSILTLSSTTIDSSEWENASRSCVKSDREKNTQLELTSTKDTFDNAIYKLLKQSETFLLSLAERCRQMPLGTPSWQQWKSTEHRR